MVPVHLENHFQIFGHELLVMFCLCHQVFVLCLCQLLCNKAIGRSAQCWSNFVGHSVHKMPVVSKKFMFP